MKERKLRFNFIDVLIILLIAAAVFALLYIFVLSDRSNEITTETQYTKIRYVIQAFEVDERFEGLVKPGDTVEEAVVRKNIGQVVGVQTEPYQKVTFDYEEGKETVADVEGQILVNVTIEADAAETDSAFSVNGCEIRVGQSYSISMPDVFLFGNCVEITAENDN